VKLSSSISKLACLAAITIVFSLNIVGIVLRKLHFPT
jgi:hypothetical protein